MAERKRPGVSFTQHPGGICRILRDHPGALMDDERRALLQTLKEALAEK